MAANAQRCTRNLTIDKRCDNTVTFSVSPLSVPADSSTSWIPWLSHREAAEWSANGTSLAHCPFVSDPWHLLCAYEQTWNCCPLKLKVKSICLHELSRSLRSWQCFFFYKPTVLKILQQTDHHMIIWSTLLFGVCHDVRLVEQQHDKTYRPELSALIQILLVILKLTVGMTTTIIIKDCIETCSINL